MALLACEESTFPKTGLYYYGARYYEPKLSRWMSSDPAGFGLVNPMEDGKPRQGYSAVEAVNWYSYVANNPVKYIDPTGKILMNVSAGPDMTSSSNNLGNSSASISEVGCVLTAYVRIANAISGKEYTLDQANSIAQGLGLFTGVEGSSVKNLLSTENGAKLIGALTGKKIGFKSVSGPEFFLQNNLNYHDDSMKQYYATGRLDTESADGTSRFGHTVNIIDSLDQEDYHMGRFE